MSASSTHLTATPPPASVSSAAPTGIQRILIAEDLEDARNSLQQVLQMALSLDVDTAEDGAKALAMLEERSYSILVTDLRMPKMNGMKLMEEIHARKLPVTVIVTTGHGGVQDAVHAMRLGAYDFLTKPADPQHLTLMVQRALRERALQDEVIALREQLQGRHSFQNVISKSPRMMEVFDLIDQISDTTSTILIIGETGTGKEQIARAVHQASAPARSGNFVAINCAAVPETLLESELFGHEKGSFTGAATQRKGRFEQAHKGTLFLDEVGDIPLNMQVKLLRVLQERKFERIGGSEPIEIDVRVVAATHQPLEQLVKEGKFREDLFYRLNVVRIDLPPLRDRPEDIPVLVSHFCSRFARPGHAPATVSPEAMEILLKSPWPGNVRQLENAIERSCVTARDGLILPANLPPDIHKRNSETKHPFQPDLARSLPEQLSELTSAFEERYLRKAMRKTRGHVGKCAKISGLSRRSITDKIAHYKIDKEEFKQE
ncbi:sigma-54-dependent transcriptional regulator [Zavarzinella formosa]|uniref:sigma-54-dependent transcriptional regulator n=1 Tax=Zavarzinella formosa TaxID=360055 RepID=UPI0002D6D2BB|nr:sigma-54 dependent transcriptional regulator [Zavarzinella formosa]